MKAKVRRRRCEGEGAEEKVREGRGSEGEMGGKRRKEKGGNIPDLFAKTRIGRCVNSGECTIFFNSSFASPNRSLFVESTINICDRSKVKCTLRILLNDKI